MIRTMLKSELAAKAGVSASTFKRWLSQHSDALLRLGVTPKSKLLPPSAVRYVSDWYGIDL